MSDWIALQPLTARDFAPFGDVLDASGEPDKWINDGLCGRYHDRARLRIDGAHGRLGVSVFKSEKRHLPYSFDLVERHPLGSQCFMPMVLAPFLVIVAPDEGRTPGRPRAFLAAAGQGVNFHAGTWHGVLSPLVEPGLFAVVDRIGEAKNLEEYRYPAPMTVVDPDGLFGG